MGPRRIHCLIQGRPLRIACDLESIMLIVLHPKAWNRLSADHTESSRCTSSLRPPSSDRERPAPSQVSGRLCYTCLCSFVDCNPSFGASQRIWRGMVENWCCEWAFERNRRGYRRWISKKTWFVGWHLDRFFRAWVLGFKRRFVLFLIVSQTRIS